MAEKASSMPAPATTRHVMRCALLYRARAAVQVRTACTGLAVTSLIALGLPAAAAAEPEAHILKFRTKAIPVPKPEGGTWPSTGNCLGCAAALELEYEIEGSGYGATAQNPRG